MEPSTFTDSLGQEWIILPDGTMVSATDPSKVVTSDLTPQWVGALNQIGSGIAEKVQQQQQADEPWWQTATRILSALSMTQQQRELMKINIERAKQGLPPIDIAQYTGVGVQVGVSPQTQQLITYGGLALLAFLVFRTLVRR